MSIAAVPRVDEALIQSICDRIVATFHPRRVVLFGSRAGLNYRPDSDIDLFVEMESEESPVVRHATVNRLFRDRWWPMDLIVMTPGEVELRRNSLSSIIPLIEREGRVIYNAEV